jgi:hypothetical protein
MTRSAAHPPGEELMALALGEADDAARIQMDAHMDACEPCRREYVGVIEALGTMAYAAPSQAAPARLRADILDAVAHEPRTVKAPTARAARPRRAARRGWADQSVWASRIAIGAGALAAVALAALVFTTGAPSTRAIPLHGVPGRVIVTNQTAALESSQFARPPTGRVYEMWVIHDGAARPAGLFTSAAGIVPVTVPVAPGDTVAVTQEPAGGSSHPTTTPLAAAAI